MIYKLKHLVTIALCIIVLSAENNNSALCQAVVGPSKFSPAQLFAPLVYNGIGAPSRSASGAPGYKYWQNRADYAINASLDTLANELTVTETIYYTNNSPDSLLSLWLQVDQNTYVSDARSQYYSATSNKLFTHGFIFNSLAIEYNGKMIPADCITTDTRLQIRLKKALAANGGKTTINMVYSYTVPGSFGGRTDFVNTKNGKIFEMGQWYPRMCVYDDENGWNILPYLGSGEFFCEYGDFDYKITVPRDMIVVASGELQNPEEVLTKKQIARLKQAESSDTTIIVRGPEEVNDPQSRPAGQGMLTWHFKMANTRDVAFGASRAYIWDAARINLPGRKTALAMSVYPVESVGPNAWSRSTEYVKKSIEHFSSLWYPYPYAVAINEAGIAGGMEYPGIAFDGMGDYGKDFFAVTAHEIGHNWFPMVVGSNERLNAWMDEGLNTFIDIYNSNVVNEGEFMPKRDAEYAPLGGNPADEIVALLNDSGAPPIMTRADLITEKYRHQVSYFKTAFGLVLLRQQILGKNRFDYAFKRYISTWAYKHPRPVDFFNTMNNEAGEDLSWFWREWFFNNWKLDLAITGFSYTNNDTAKGGELVIANLEKMAMPFTVEYVLSNGEIRRIDLPVETWLQNSSKTIHLNCKQRVVSIKLDPDKRLPDSNRENNNWVVKE